MKKDKAPRLGIFHQAGDYIVAAMLLFSLGRAEVRIWPFAIGLVVLANAAMTRGPLGAYRKIGLVSHKAIDAVVIAACIAGAVAVRDHGTDTLVLVVVAIVQLFVVWLSRLAKQARD